MIESLTIVALAAVFGAGLWLVQRPWALRHWLRNAEWAHRSNAALYQDHYGEPPPWLNDFTPPPPPRAIRLAARYRAAGLALMAVSAAVLYNRLSRSGVI